MLPEQNMNNNNSKNNASQTLFRFVSLRNPQLTETHPEKNLGFVHLSKDHSILFGEAIPVGIWDSSNGSKITALENQISIIDSQNSNYFYKTKSEVVTDFSDYFPAAEKIAKNELENIVNFLPQTVTFPSSYSKLWDNLIYQVLTQKDFYVKESILQVIKAIHFSLHQNNESHLILRDAKVVLPGRLFVDSIIDDGIDAEDTPNVFTVNESLISTSYIAEDPDFNRLSASTERKLANYAKKNQELALAISEKSRIDHLKSEINLISKNYQRDYNNALKTSQEDYLTSIEPLLDEYEAQLNLVRYSFTEEQTSEEQQALLDAVPYPTLPNFQFSYSTFDSEYLKEKLSQKSFETMSDVLNREFVGGYNVESSNQTIQSFNNEASPDVRILPVEGVFTQEELDRMINAQNSEFATKIVTATELDKEEYANIGGASVRIQNVTAQNPFSAVLTPKVNIRWDIVDFKQLYDFDLVLEVPDTSWEIDALECQVKGSLGNILEFIPKEFSIDGLKLLINNIFNDQFTISELYDFTEFTAKFYFKNNREGILTFKLNDPTVDHYFAKLVLAQGNTGKKAFNPKNFGIKRLGVADYLKVVQSVHAYVPGEVSNIENVMASELRHKSISERTLTETTTTTTKFQEVEKMTDTSKVNRSEMQSEVARELDRQQNIEAHTSYSANGAAWKFDMGGSFANSNAQRESTRQATIKAQEITERALERVVSKISEERIQKIVHDVQLNNVHEFDNRGKIGSDVTPQHITGVYRWVDKKVKNQIFNYGKRTMFEFMIPEPARLHRLATKSVKTILTPPIDPRKVTGIKQMKDATSEEATIQYWADYYKVKLEQMPEKFKSVSESKMNPGNSGIIEYDIPQNYLCEKFEGSVSYKRSSGWITNAKIWVYHPLDGKQIYYNSDSNGNITPISGLNIQDKLKLSYKGQDLSTVTITLKLSCKLSDVFVNNWKKTSFDAIIEEYDKQYADFKQAQADADAASKAEEEKNKDKVSTFYREMESNILKHNCIAYLLQDYNGIGKALSTDDNQTMESFSVTIDENLDAYTSLAKFLEQAFEWNVMDYTFYPYYWAENKHWKEMYLSEELDPLFRNFLQAGMARVVVTVKPGFEDAVNFYMATGKIWNGGEVPVIGDPMFLSIADELREPTGKPQGKYWISTIPTSLTILQAKSAGLEVTDALPIFPETDLENCENPDELVFESPFALLEDAKMEGSDLATTLPREVTNVIVTN
ncbi:hypothetical protein [Cloacibacterium sp. TD35]|uniref:hypothetical protein n=1 Tax=Cloacibacterium sp. TD35 TaxID=2976818 RepID=UPI00237E9738|nr:hypothetical protein [Cloacibacterium sp. TD35]WDT68023.1 hypothetical protein N7277_00010 [Cloacibacterium sp. TD35]